MTLNRKVSGRELRRQLAAQGNVAQVAYANETVTRQRLDALQEGLHLLAGTLSRPFWGRLRWLVLGK